MTAYICICSAEYLNHYKILYNSLLKHASTYDTQILYHIGNVQESFDQKVDITDWFNAAQYPDTLTKICSLRARVVLDAFDRGHNKVVFLGAKVEFFADSTGIDRLLNFYDAVGTPHITSPLPEDGLFPSNASVSFTGHLSTDVVAFKDTPAVRKFLKWQDEIMSQKCATTHQTYLDQSWLNFLPFFVPNTHILRNHGWNVAYWNMHQRNLLHIDGNWVVTGEEGQELPLVCFQYSGLEKGNEELISRHQNRWIAQGKILDFLKDYTSKL